MNHSEWIYRVYGEPVPWKEPVVSVIHKTNPKTGKPFMIQQNKPPEVTKWQAEIRKQIMQQELPPKLLSNPIILRLWVFITRPKTSKRVYPSVTTDGDDTNYLKAAQDALNAQWGRSPTGKRIRRAKSLVWVDDCQCVDSRVILRWAYMPYGDLGHPRKPGLLFKIELVELPDAYVDRMNSGYQYNLAAENLEYKTITVGKGKKAKKKTVLMEV